MDKKEGSPIELKSDKPPDIPTDWEKLLPHLKRSWQQFDGAGSHFLVRLVNSLAGNQYEGVCKEIIALLGPVFGCGESELVSGHLREMETALQQLQQQQDENHINKADNTSTQAIIRCLLLFVKLQADYHLLCSNLVSSAVDKLCHSCLTEDSENSILHQQIQALELRNLNSPLASSNKHKKLTAATLGSPKVGKHGSFKASLFSFFERKNSPEESNSSFYVDIDPQNKDSKGLHINEMPSSQSELVPDSHVTATSQSELLVDLSLDSMDASRTSQEPKFNSPLKKVPCAGNGQVASQEELDSVINLLSGASITRSAPMSKIPEQGKAVSVSPASRQSWSPYSPSQTGHSGLGSSNNLQLPPSTSLYSRTSLSPTTSENLEGKSSSLRSKGQRRSEGSIDVSGFNLPGHNTWPNQHRASLPGGQLAPPQITYDFASPPPSQPYSCAGYRPNTLPPGGAGHFQAAYNMSFPDPKLNRTWPVNNLAGSGSLRDTINSTWSGGQDSDDLSDDSSTGETEHRRDLYRDGPDSLYKHEDRPADVKHHSLEDLLQDSRSNTWPQQLQPWSHSQLGMDLIGPHHQQVPFHRPISMQMSDPLSRRNIWQNTGELPSQPHP